MSFEGLQERLTALQETTRQLQELISRLANLKFQPGSIPLDDEEGNVSTELSDEISDTLREQAEDLELLEQEVLDFPAGRKGSKRDQDKSYMLEIINKASRDLKAARQAFRQAQLAAKENLEDAQRIERSLLLSSFVNTSSQPDDGPSFVPRHKPGPLTKEERELNASSDVTLALRRTHNLMQSELSRSQFAHDTLKESTAALGQLSEQYNTLDTMLAGTKNLLGTLLRSQKSDTWYLETAFMILAVTVGWLIFRRFLYGPAWWFIYLPLKLFYKAWMGVFVAVGLRSDRNGVFASNEAAVAGITIVGGAAQPVMAGTQLPTMSVNGMPRGTQSPGDGQGNEDSMIEEVGRIIDDAQQEKEETVEIHDDEAEKSRQGDSQRNPKKRMWEEGEDAKIWQKKDEL